MSDFLAGVERRAYKQALFAVRDEEVALDVVQDAMLKLTEKYSGKPIQELPLLFTRILQNATRDYFRRQKVRSTWTTLFSSLTGKNDDEEDRDPLETLEVESNNGVGDTPPARSVGLAHAVIEIAPSAVRSSGALPSVRPSTKSTAPVAAAAASA
mgnify:CR=1 FL=1